MKKLEVLMLGNLQIFLEGKNITDNISHKGVGLFCYLIMNKEKTFSREKLSSIFWSNSNADAARYNLRYNLWSLRKILEEEKNETEILVCGKDTCEVNHEKNIYVDVFHMEELFNKLPIEQDNDYIQKLENIKEIYEGEFLEGFYIKECLEFNDWIFYERENLQRKYFNTLSKLAAIYKSKGKFHNSIDNLEEMLRINPLQENLYVRLIKLYLEMGDRGTALQQYERCCKILREELNISPMEETKKIYEDIRTHRTTENNKIKDRRKLGDNKLLTLEDKGVYLGKTISINHDKLIIPCYPISEVRYYWLSNLVREIIKTYEIHVLKKLPNFYWRDIYRIESSVAEIIKDIKTVDNLTVETEKNRIFTAILELIHLIIEFGYLDIEVSNIEFMDEVSFQFLKLLLFNSKNLDISITIKGKNVGNRISILERHFQLKKV